MRKVVNLIQIESGLPYWSWCDNFILYKLDILFSVGLYFYLLNVIVWIWWSLLSFTKYTSYRFHEFKLGVWGLSICLSKFLIPLFYWLINSYWFYDV